MERTSLRELLMLGGAGGGSGASNIVTGTFTGETAGATMDVTIPYTGNGHPVIGVVFPKNGTNKPGDAFATLIQKFAEVQICFVKNDFSVAPDYTSSDATENKFTVSAIYKYSDSDPFVFSSSKAEDAVTCNKNSAASTSANCVRFTSKTKMSVYIASTSYGFAKDIEYTYYLIYSE